MDIGHVHLNVEDLDRSIEFYREVIGLEVVLKMPKFAFLRGDADTHHHVALDSRSALGVSRLPEGATGLHHFAVRFPTRQEWAAAVRRAQKAGVEVSRTADFCVLLAVFISDPDGNGIEISYSLPPDEWPASWATQEGLGTPRPLAIDEVLRTV